MSGGHIRRRGKSLEIRWRENGKTRTRTIRAELAQARAELRAALVAVDRGEHVEPIGSRSPSSSTSASRRGTPAAGSQAEPAEADQTAAQRLASIAGIPVQRLGSADVERLHLGWRHLSSWSKRASHGVLQRALTDALRHRVCTRNAAADQGPPRGGKRPEVVMLDADQVAALVARLDDEWRAPVIVALYCGLRRSEQLALKWNSDRLGRRQDGNRRGAGRSRRQGQRQTAQSKAGRRVISLPQIVVVTLRDHRRRQLERALLPGCRPPARQRLSVSRHERRP